jgi:hypothetical protein
MNQFFQVLFVVLLSSVKFFLVPPIALLQYKFPVWNAILYSSIGGTLGVLVFYFLSKELMIVWQFIVLYIKRKHKPHKYHHKHHIKPKFSNLSRRIVRLKNKWGLYGLAVLTPCVLSIPFGTFIAARFFPGKRTILLLCCSVLIWSLILNLGIFFFKSSV